MKNGGTSCFYAGGKGDRCPARVGALTVVHVAVSLGRVQLDGSQVELLRLGLLTLGETEFYSVMGGVTAPPGDLSSSHLAW